MAGKIARPRQVRAGVPPEVDEIAWRALQPDADDPLETPAQVADALGKVDLSSSTPSTGSAVRNTPWLAVVGVAVVMLFVLAAALVGWQVWQNSTRPDASENSLNGQNSSPPNASASPSITPEVPLTLVSATAFDPAGNGEENDSDADLAIDGNPDTSWQTLTYTTRALGDIKPGVGLEIQLDGEQAVGGIELNLVGQGTDLQIWAKEPGPASPTDSDPLNGYRKLASVPGAGDQLTYRFAPAVQTRSVLIWLTGLPAEADGYRGGVAEVRLVS